MKLYEQFSLNTALLIQEAAMKQLEERWDFKTERLLRMPMSGEVFDAVNCELNEKGMPSIGIWTIFARGAGGVQEIHVDAFSASARMDSGVIVPVLGATSSKMQWFSEEGTRFVSIPTLDRKSFYFKNLSKTIPTMIEEVEVANPMLVKLRVPHRAVAASDQPRAVVSIKLVGNPILL